MGKLQPLVDLHVHMKGVMQEVHKSHFGQNGVILISLVTRSSSLIWRQNYVCKMSTSTLNIIVDARHQYAKCMQKVQKSIFLPIMR